MHTSFRLVTSNALLVLKLNAIAYFEERTELHEENFFLEDAAISQHLSQVEAEHATSNRKRAHYYEEQEEFDEQKVEQEQEQLRQDESLRVQIMNNLTEHTEIEQSLEESDSKGVCHYLSGVCDFFRGSPTVSRERLEIVQLSSELNATTKSEYLENLTSSMLEHEIHEYNETATELLDLAQIWEDASQLDQDRARMDEATAHELARLVATERRAMKQLSSSLWKTIEVELHTAIQKLFVIIFLALVGMVYYARRLFVRVSELHPEQRAALLQDFLQYSVISVNAMTTLSLLSHDIFLNFVADTVDASQRIAGWAWMSIFGSLLFAVVRPADTMRIRLIHFGLGCCLFPIFNGMVFLILSLFRQDAVIGLFSHAITRILGLVVLFAQSYAFREYYDGSTLPTTTRDDETLFSEMSPLRSDAMSEVSPLPSEPYYSGKSTTRISFRSVATTTQFSQLFLYIWLLLAMMCGKLLLESRNSFLFHPFYTTLLYLMTIAGCVYVHYSYPHPSGAPVRSVHV